MSVHRCSERQKRSHSFGLCVRMSHDETRHRHRHRHTAHGGHWVFYHPPRHLFISVQASHCGHATALLAVAVASAFVAFAADCSNEGRHITASIHRSTCSLLGKSFLLPVHSGAYTLIAWLVVCSFAEFVTIAKIVYSLCADREWPAIATGRRQHNTAGQ